jgi:hypothetical protein
MMYSTVNAGRQPLPLLAIGAGALEPNLLKGFITKKYEIGGGTKQLMVESTRSALLAKDYGNFSHWCPRHAWTIHRC